MQLVKRKREENQGTTQILLSLPVGSDTALEVPSGKARSVRAIIARLKKTRGMMFSTKKIESGIVVWRDK